LAVAVAVADAGHDSWGWGGRLSRRWGYTRADTLARIDPPGDCAESNVP
jgi:hypothetical protein